jgi:4-alpha-glucanotransferase
MNRKQTVPKEARHILLNVPPEMYRKFRSNCVNEDTNMRAKLLALIASYNEEKKKKETVKDFKEFLEMPKEEREALLAEATHKAIKETHALGLPTTHGDDKGVYRLYPDGHREYIEVYEKK